MDVISPQLLCDCSVLSDTDPADLRPVYEAAVERLDLQMIDYLTIRDLAALSGDGGTPLHLLLIAMFISLYEGSVCLRLGTESLKKKLEPVTGDRADSYIRSILSGMSAFSELIYEKDPSGPLLFDDPRESYKPLILVSDGKDRFLYFQKYYAAEQALKTTLTGILSRKTRAPENPDALTAAVKTVLMEKPVLINGAPAVLNAGQLLGVLMPALNNFVLVSGGPGTGKTFIVIDLLRIMARLGVPPDRMKITAPTGRAAQKLAEAVRRGVMSLTDPDEPDLALASIQGATLHRLLRYSPSRNDFMHNRYNKLPADLIIIDEASMIDIILLGRLLEAAEEGTGIVMLGDRNQLPSIEAGAVLSDLISGGRTASYSDTAAAVIRGIVPDMEAGALPAAPDAPGAPLEDRVVLLTDSYRSERSITSIASRINEQDESVIGDIPVLDPRRGLPESGVWRIDPEQVGGQYHRGLHEILAAWAARYYESVPPSLQGASYRDIVSEAAAALPAGGDGSGPVHALFSRIDEARILSPMRSGPAGTGGINRYLINRIGRSLDPAGTGGLFAGTPIIITRNDYDRSLFNGDVGVIMKGHDGRYSGLFSRFDGFVSYPVEGLPPFEPSFAITVHKSQGSEYGGVLLVLPEGMTESLMTKEILYTGLTRAKHLVIIYAGRDMLRRAIQNRLERESGIRF